MDWLIWTGAAVALLGVGGLVWCIVLALRAKRSGLDGDALRIRLGRVMMVNLGAVAVSALGLMLVVAGILLG